MVKALKDGRVVQVFLSQKYSDLENLSNYNDPFDLRNSFLGFEYELNGQDSGTYEIVIRLINPSSKFEKTYLKYYSLIFEDGRIQDKSSDSISGNDLLYYIRWGYGNKESDGLSRIIPAYLTAINYNFNAPGEREVSLTFVDALTNSRKDLQTAEGLGAVKTTIINCLDGKNRLRPISDLVSEIIGEMAKGFETSYPFVDLVNSSEVANLLNRLQVTIAAQLAGENTSEDDLILALSKAGVELDSQYRTREFANGLGEISITENLIPPIWGSFEKTKTPSKIHHLLAYKLIFEELGIGFSYGVKTKQVEVSRVTLETAANILTNLPSFVNALAARITTKPIASLDIPISGEIFEVGYDNTGKRNDVSVGTVNDGIIQSPGSLNIDERMLQLGIVYFRPSFKTPSYEDGKLLVEEKHPNKALADSYYLNSEQTLYVALLTDSIIEIRKILNSIATHVDRANRQVVEADKELNSFVSERDDEEIEIIDSIFVEISFSKSTFESSKSSITALLEDINAFVGVYEGVEDHLLGMFVVPYAALSSDEKKRMSSAIADSVTESSTVLFIAPRSRMRTIIGATLFNSPDHQIQSFKELTTQDTLNLEFGYESSRNIITKIELNQDLLFAKARVAVENKTLTSIYELFNDNGVARTFKQVTKLFLDSIPHGLISSYTPPQFEFKYEAGKLLESKETENYAELINYTNTFYSDVRSNKYGEELKVIFNSDFAQQYISVINSPVFQDLFTDTDPIKKFGYTAINGSLVSKQSNTLSHYSVKQDKLDNFIKGKFNFYNARLASLLYKYPFSMSIETVGIPELSNFVFDISHRTVNLKILDTRTRESHWASGIYKILGYTHTISSAGYLTNLNITRMPYYDTKTLL
jgi:hypothetical protein